MRYLIDYYDIAEKRASDRVTLLTQEFDAKGNATKLLESRPARGSGDEIITLDYTPSATTFFVIEWSARLWGSVVLDHSLEAFAKLTPRNRAARHANWGMLMSRPWFGPRADMHMFALRQQNWEKGIPAIDLVRLDNNPHKTYVAHSPTRST